MSTLIVSGSRNANQGHIVSVDKVLFQLHAVEPITLLVHGGCRGVDQIAALWAAFRKIPVKVYSADWDQHGRKAGPMRNLDMLVSHPGARVAAFPLGYGTSPGTRGMIKLAKKRGHAVTITELL